MSSLASVDSKAAAAFSSLPHTSAPPSAPPSVGDVMAEKNAFFQEHPAQDIPVDKRKTLRKSCQSIADLPLDLRFGLEWRQCDCSKSLIEVFMPFPILRSSLEELFEAVTQGSEKEMPSLITNLFDTVEKEIRQDERTSEKGKALFDIVRGTVIQAQNILFYRVESILGVGLSPELRQNLESLHLIPTEVGSALTIGQGVHKSCLKWICEEFSGKKELTQELLAWMEKVQSGITRPLPEGILSQCSKAQKKRQALYERTFSLMNNAKLGSLQLRHIPTQAQPLYHNRADCGIDVSALSSTEKQLSSYYQVWTNQAQRIREGFRSYIRKATSIIDDILKIACDQAEERFRGSQKGRFSRPNYLKELRLQSKELRALTAFERDVERFNRTYDSRMVPLGQAFNNWKKNREVLPLLLTQLESTFRWMSLHLTSFKNKTKPLTDTISQLWLSSAYQKSVARGDAKEENGYVTFDVSREDFDSNLSRELDVLGTLTLLLSSAEDLTAEMKTQIQRLESAAFQESSMDLVFEIEDWMAQKAPSVKSATFEFEEDEKEDQTPAISASKPTSAAKKEPLKPVSPETISGKVLQVVPDLIAPWELSEIESREVADHLFLATQSIEILCQLYGNRRFDLLGVCLQGYLIDCHVALEKVFKKKTPSHSLQKIAQAAGWQGVEEERLFLQNHDQALLWARYPAYYFNRHQNQLPPPLAWLKTLMTAKPEEMEATFQAILSSYRSMMSLIGQNRLPPSLFSDLEKIAANPSHLGKVDPKPKNSELDQALEKLQKALEESVILPNTEGDPVLCLQEVHHYLTWMKQAQVLRQLFPHPKWEYWMTRVELNMDKLFEHLLTAGSLLHDRGSPHSHNLRIHIEALGDLYPDLSSNSGLLQQINLNIGHHYIHETSFALSQQCRQILQQSKQHELVASSGFEPVQGRKKEVSSLRPLIHDSRRLFVGCLSWVLDRLASRQATPQSMAEISSRV